MIVKLLTEHQMEFLSLKGGCTGSSESNLSKCQIVGNHMPWLKCKIIFEFLQVGIQQKINVTKFSMHNLICIFGIAVTL